MSISCKSAPRHANVNVVTRVQLHGLRHDCNYEEGCPSVACPPLDNLKWHYSTATGRSTTRLQLRGWTLASCMSTTRDAIASALTRLQLTAGAHMWCNWEEGRLLVACPPINMQLRTSHIPCNCKCCNSTVIAQSIARLQLGGDVGQLHANHSDMQLHMLLTLP